MCFTKIRLFGAMALLALFAACQKDKPITPGGSTNWPGETVSASFIGQVLDEAGQPIAEAVVRVAASTVKTDKNGIFFIRDQKVNSARAIVTAFKAGFWDTQRTLFVGNNSENRLLFSLLEKKKTGDFPALTGGKLSVPGGGELDFPANAISKNGKIYSGKVNAAARWLDPTDNNLSEKMPGALRGLRNNGEENGLATFGMMGIELTDDNGVELEIATGKTVQISMPIPASLLAKAPQKIELWHFSTKEGIWVEEGEAEKVGSNYVGQVAHFSWWNCDQPFEAIKLKICIVNDEGSPLVNFSIILTSPTFGPRYGVTDRNGCAEGLVPANETLLMGVEYNLPCGGSVFFTQDIGPFAANTDLGPITVNPTNGSNYVKAVIKGRAVDCLGQPVADAYAYSTDGYLAITDPLGIFSYDRYYCINNTPASVGLKVVDWSAGKESQPQTLPVAPIVDFGDIATCDDLDEYLRYDLDGAGLVTMAPYTDSSFAFNETFMYGFIPNGQQYLSLGFSHNKQPENDLPLQFFQANNIGADMLPNGSLKTDMTNYPTLAGQYLTGTFGGTFVDSTSVSHTVIGSYRVKR